MMMHAMESQRQLPATPTTMASITPKVTCYQLNNL
jgi:hypothetical protein